MSDVSALDPAANSDTRCLDCGAERLGDYCHECGQHHRDDRLTLRSVWRDFAERFLKFERGLPATIWMAATDPGRLARDYVSGRRRRYVNPVSFLLIGSAMAVLLIPLYGSIERLVDDPTMGMRNAESSAAFGYDTAISMSGRDPSEIDPEQRAEAIADATEMQSEILPLYLSTVNQLYSVFSVILALALAAFLKLFFGGRARSDTFAETLVLGLYAAGIYTALSAIIASTIALSGGDLLVGMVATTTLLVIGAAWAAAGFYGRTWGAAALGAVSGVAALAVYMVGVVVIAFPIVIIKMI